MKHFLFVAVLLSIPCMLSAFSGTNIGPDVSELDGKKLQWEAGSFDYFIMFKSLMTDNTRTQCDYTNSNQQLGCDLPNNPEPDTCLSQSTFTLESSYIPPDSYVEAAYLVWTTSVDPNAISSPTDNTATLSFVSADGTITNLENVVAPRQGVVGTDSDNGVQDFTFEGIAIENSGTIYGGYYTYRVDVTDFFTQIHEYGREAGYGSDGLSLLGNYTVSDVSCTNNYQYISQVSGGSIYSSTDICGWSLIMVYRSVQIEPKMVYIYNGFSQYQNQQVDLTVSGFEFPDKPMVKMSFAVNEGDPGFAYSSGCGSMGFAACPPEGLQVTGATTSADSLVILQNDCNPAKFTDSDGNAFNYSETYNSISSVYGWEDVSPTCIGGDPNSPNANTLEYTMDVDTFRMDAETDSLFDAQFKKGDTAMFFKIGANRDVVYTNYMVISVDTKAPRYDIPSNPETPTGREKGFCSCSTESDAVCFTAPFYYSVKIQNWGDDISTNVTVQDTLPSQVSYVSGTTEICKDWKAANVCSEWKKIDDVDGAFPLASPYLVTDILDYCDPLTMECPETIMVRFKVLPNSNLQKHEVIENTALINDDSGKVYKTNTSIPLRLVSGLCPSASECENPDLTECGGANVEGCEKDSDCGDGEICNSDKQCVIDTDKFTKDATITFAVGKNSPVNSSEIIIPAPSNDLVVGQFSMIASGDFSSDKFYYFESVKPYVNKNSNVSFSNMKLVYDENADGAVSTGEPIVAEASTIDANYATFALKKGYTVYKAGELHHFLIVVDAAYSTPDNIPVNATFSFSIDETSAISVKDLGEAKVEMATVPIEFAEYKFEPTKEFFVFTKGIDPAVPAASEINTAVVVMQIRSKALKHSNTLEKIRFKTASKSVLFGEGIKDIKIYVDENKDGISAGDTMVGSATASTATSILDVELTQPVTYSENEEKYLLVICDFAIPADKMAQISIPNGKVYLEQSVDLLGLPVESKEFWNKCEEGDLSCGSTVNEGDDGCSVTVID